MTFTVISSNIRFANPEDGNHDWIFRKNFLSKMLSAHQPDLIGTQEGRAPQIKELHHLLPNFSLLDTHRTWIQERMYPCFFYLPHRLRPIRHIDIWLSQTPHLPESKSFGSMFPRLALLCEFEFIPYRLRFIAVVCHLDHMLETTRLGQINVLINEVLKFNPLNLPCLLMGDFNSDPNESTHQALTGKEKRFSLKDPWEELSLPEAASTHKFGKTREGAKRIDWILIPEHWNCQEIFFDKGQEGGIWPSDHYPVIAKLMPR